MHPIFVHLASLAVNDDLGKQQAKANKLAEYLRYFVAGISNPLYVVTSVGSQNYVLVFAALTSDMNEEIARLICKTYLAAISIP